MIKYLVKNDANINASDKYSETPFKILLDKIYFSTDYNYNDLKLKKRKFFYRKWSRC